jgi:transcriptional regulator with XRE-family HTH domain
LATDDQKTAFRQSLRRERERRNLSQRALSRLTGVSHSAVSQWESGRALPEPTKVVLLEHALELEPGSLSRLLGYMPIAREVDQAALEVMKALEADPRLGDREREFLAAMYRELVRQRARDDAASKN